MGKFSNKIFNNPKNWGEFDLTTTQTDKKMIFDWDSEVIPEAKVLAFQGSGLIKTYTVGDGLVLSNLNKTVTLTLNGSDFVNYINQTLNFKCNFFIQGDEESVFQLCIIKGYF